MGIKNFFKKSLSTLALFGAFSPSSKAKEVNKTEIEFAIEKAIENSSVTENTHSNSDNSIENIPLNNKNLKEKNEEDKSAEIIIKKGNLINTSEIQSQTKSNSDKLKINHSDENVFENESREESKYQKTNENLVLPSANIQQDDKNQNNLELTDEMQNHEIEEDFVEPRLSEKEMKQMQKEIDKIQDKFLNTLLDRAKQIMLDGKKIEHLNGSQTAEIRILCHGENGEKEEKFFVFDLKDPIDIIYTGICKLLINEQMFPYFKNKEYLTPDMQFKLNIYKNYISEYSIYNYIKNHLDKLPRHPDDTQFLSSSKYEGNNKQESEKIIPGKSDSPSRLKKLGHEIKSGYKKVKTKISNTFKTHK